MEDISISSWVGMVYAVLFGARYLCSALITLIDHVDRLDGIVDSRVQRVLHVMADVVEGLDKVLSLLPVKRFGHEP